jgi:AraC-like DNA-binding protein
MEQQNKNIYVEVDIYRQLEAFAEKLSGEMVDRNNARLTGDSGSGTLHGAVLAPGLELICMDINLQQRTLLPRPSSPNYHAWTIALSDSPSMRFINTDVAARDSSQGGAAYLFNNYANVDILFDNTGPSRLVGLRLKPEIWATMLKNQPDHLRQLITTPQAYFAQFPMTDLLLDSFFKLLPKNRPQSERLWGELSTALAICGEMFLLLAQLNSATDTGIHQIDAQRLEQAEQLLSDFSKRPDMAAIGKEVGLGRDKFRQLFQRKHAMTPYQYFQQKRMEKAKSLILSGSHNAMQAGKLVGYSCLSHFSSAFKKQFGCLPSYYKKKSRLLRPNDQ